MKILYLNPTSSLGGAERVLLSVIAAVREADPRAELHLFLPSDGPLVAAAEQTGVRVSLVPMPNAVAALGDSQLDNAHPLRALPSLLLRGLSAAPAAWRYVGLLRHRIRELAPDVIHSNGIKTHLLGRLVRGRGVPVLWHAHDFYGRRPVVGRLLRLARKGVAGAVAVSEAVARDVRRVAPGLPVRVIYNTVDADRFSPAARNGGWLDAAAGLPPADAGTVRIGLIATYARWKGHYVFLQAAERLMASDPPRVRFYVVGGPIYQTRGSQFSAGELRSLARRRRLEEHVGFVGFQDDPVEAFRALDVVIHASTLPEPFGLTIIEAMACARAVVAASAGGAAELFRDGYDALGATPGDAEALAAAMRRLVEDAPFRLSLGENARRTVLERFQRDEVGGRFMAIYEHMRLGALGYQVLCGAWPGPAAAASRPPRTTRRRTFPSRAGQ